MPQGYPFFEHGHQEVRVDVELLMYKEKFFGKERIPVPDYLAHSSPLSLCTYFTSCFPSRGPLMDGFQIYMSGAFDIRSHNFFSFVLLYQDFNFILILVIHLPAPINFQIRALPSKKKFSQWTQLKPFLKPERNITFSNCNTIILINLWDNLQDGLPKS